MTSKENPKPSKPSALEEILGTIRSIDRNVEEILDRMTSYFDDMTYARDLRSYGFGHEAYDYGDEL